MRLRPVLLGSTLLGACTSAPGAEPAAPSDGSRSAVVSATLEAPVASALVGGSASAPPDPAPPATTRAPAVAPRLSYPDGLDVLGDLCTLAEKDGVKGCACCPPFDGCGPKKGKAAPLAAEPAYTPQVVLKGSFSAKGQEEAILGTSFQCQDNLSSYGHAVVARRAGGRWKLVDEMVTSLEYGTTYRRPDGRDLAIVLSAEGKTPTYTLATWEIGRGPKGHVVHEEAIMEWTTNAYSGCLGVEPGTSVLDLRILSLTQTDRDGDGKLDLVASLLERSGEPNPAYKKLCVEMFGEEKDVDPASALRARRIERVFRFDGASFKEHVASAPPK